MTSGRWKLGLLLAVVTALMWGVLPIALKLLLDVLDAYTVVWFRFALATLLLGGWQWYRGTLPTAARMRRAGGGLLLIAIVGLLGNYLFYMLGLDYVTAGVAQVVIQLAPMLFLLGGMVFFGERFGALQWFGFGLLAVGLLLFFNHRLAELFAARGDYFTGVALVVVASLSWAGYALAQKRLLLSMGSQEVMLVLYAAGALAFLPPSVPASLQVLDGAGVALLLFASLNTLIAYGAFAEALNHWEASRISAILATTPLLTLGAMAALATLTEQVVREPLNMLSIAGALLVVIGSALGALANGKAAARADRDAA